MVASNYRCNYFRGFLYASGGKSQLSGNVSNLAAYALFVALAYVGQKLTNETVQKIFDIISKYSYSVFLVHHYIIMKTLSTFQGREFGIAGTVLLYLVCWAQIIILAKLLYMVNNGVIKVFKKSKKEQIKETNAVLGKE